MSEDNELKIVPNFNHDLFIVEVIYDENETVHHLNFFPIIAWCISCFKTFPLNDGSKYWGMYGVPISINSTVYENDDSIIFNKSTNEWWRPEKDEGIGIENLIDVINETPH